eukprot:4948344-Lingulodinium_polyedra.AAC.1
MGLQHVRLAGQQMRPGWLQALVGCVSFLSVAEHPEEVLHHFGLAKGREDTRGQGLDVEHQ